MFKTMLRAILLGSVLALLFVALRDMRRTPSNVSETQTVAAPVFARDSDLRHRSYRAAVQTAAPSVVKIHIAVPPKQGEKKVQVGLGSGVVLSSDGYLVTNFHVIKDAGAIAVVLPDGQTRSARLVGSDQLTDLAVIKVDGVVLKPIALAKEAAHVGDLVLAIGYPFLLGQTVTQGIISATEKLDRGFVRLVQTDAAINKGNSGGALVNTDGELLGINSEVLPTQLGIQGIGFAIPVDYVQSIVEQIIQHGHVIRGTLGFFGTGIDGDVHDQNAAWHLSAVKVDGVDANGAAEKAGLKAGDSITHINGELISGVTDLLQRIAYTKPGTAIQLRIRRNEQIVELTAIVQEKE